MNTDDLIDRLGHGDIRVTPLAAPGVRTAGWLLWGVVYLGVFSLMKYAAMSSPGGIAMTPLYVLQQIAALATGIAAARAALISVVPGRSPRAWLLPAAAGGAWIGLLLWDAAASARATGTWGFAAESDWPCVASMLAGAVVLGAPLIWMLRRGAPLTPRATALLAAIAALSLANIEACLTRPHAFALSILLWHGLTIAGVAALCAAMGRRWIRWPDARVGA